MVIQMARLTKGEKRMLAEMKEARDLLAEFGLTLHGFDPGVTAWFKGDRLFPAGGGVDGQGYFGEPIAFNHAEWKWLKPLLAELRDRRKDAA